MRIVQQIFFLLVVTTIQPSFVFAQAEVDAEVAAQQAFRDDFQTIVDAMNVGSFEPFAAAIDKDDFLERIFGLRLIDQKVKKKYKEDFKLNSANMIKSTVADKEGGVRATLLGIASRGTRGRAVVRFDYENFQFRYHEYDLRRSDKGRLIIIDWFDFLAGERYSDGVGTALVIALPSKVAVRKFVDFNSISERELFQLTELMKAARDRRVDKYFEIVDTLDEKLKRQRIVVLTGVQLTKLVRDRRKMRTALISMAKYFPDEPSYSLMLLDYYFPSRKYEDAMQALLRLHQRLDVDDAAMQARLSAAALVTGNATDAGAYADRALTLEPGLELGWWSAMRARVALSQFDRTIEALQQLEQQFGHSLGPDELQRDRSLASLLASEDYKGWLATRE